MTLKLSKNGDVVQVDENGSENPLITDSKPLKVQDVIGRSLKYIGKYYSLDNTKQVVALVDDVSIYKFVHVTFEIEIKITILRICVSIAESATWLVTIRDIKQSSSIQKLTSRWLQTTALVVRCACLCVQLSTALRE